MEQWLEERYKKEVERWVDVCCGAGHLTICLAHSVTCLAKVLRQAIEKEEKLMCELALPGTEFKIVEVGVSTWC